MELKKAAIYILTVLLLFFCSTAVFAEELVIPVIKSPYKIDKAEWVNNGREFAITTNNETYVRDTLDLSLKDKYPQKNNTELIGNFPSPVIAYGKNTPSSASYERIIHHDFALTLVEILRLLSSFYRRIQVHDRGKSYTFNMPHFSSLHTLIRWICVWWKLPQLH